MALFPEESASCVHTDLFMILSPLKAQSSCTQDHFHPAQARGAEFRSPEPTHKLSSLPLCPGWGCYGDDEHRGHKQVGEQ